MDRPWCKQSTADRLRWPARRFCREGASRAEYCGSCASPSSSQSSRHRASVCGFRPRSATCDPDGRPSQSGPRRLLASPRRTLATEQYSAPGISETSGGPAASTFHVASLQRLYANFTWATPPAPGQKLEIQWQGPTGELRAIWVNRTVSSDSPGTRIFAWISAAKLKQAPGTWRVLLVVGGVTRSTRAFRATTRHIPP